MVFGLYFAYITLQVWIYSVKAQDVRMVSRVPELTRPCQAHYPVLKTLPRQGTEKKNESVEGSQEFEIHFFEEEPIDPDSIQKPTIHPRLFENFDKDLTELIKGMLFIDDAIDEMEGFVLSYYSNWLEQYQKIVKNATGLTGLVRFIGEPLLLYERIIVENLAEVTDCYNLVKYRRELVEMYYIDEVKYSTIATPDPDNVTAHEFARNQKVRVDQYVAKMTVYVDMWKEFRQKHLLRAKRDMDSFKNLLYTCFRYHKPQFEPQLYSEYRPIQFDYVYKYKIFVLYYKRHVYISRCVNALSSGFKKFMGSWIPEKLFAYNVPVNNKHPAVLESDEDAIDFLQMMQYYSTFSNNTKYTDYMQNRYRNGTHQRRLDLWRIQNKMLKDYNIFPDPWFLFFPVTDEEYIVYLDFNIAQMDEYFPLLDKYKERLEMTHDAIDPKERQWYISKYREYRNMIRDYHYILRRNDTLKRFQHRSLAVYLRKLDYYEEKIMDRYDDLMDLWETTKPKNPI